MKLKKNDEKNQTPKLYSFDILINDEITSYRTLNIVERFNVLGDGGTGGLETDQIYWSFQLQHFTGRENL